MPKPKLKIGDTVVLSKDPKDPRLGKTTGKIVELSTFRPDGKKPSDFKPGVYGSITYGVVWEATNTAIYYFEEDLKILPNKQ